MVGEKGVGFRVGAKPLPETLHSYTANSPLLVRILRIHAHRLPVAILPLTSSVFSLALPLVRRRRYPGGHVLPSAQGNGIDAIHVDAYLFSPTVATMPHIVSPVERVRATFTEKEVKITKRVHDRV